MIKCVFHKEKPDPIDTVYEKHIYHSQDQLVVGFWPGSLVELKGLAKLANLTVFNMFIYNTNIFK